MVEQEQGCSKEACRDCQENNELNFDFTMAFQPIINCRTQTIYGYEALVRGVNKESAHAVIAQVTAENRHAFDQQCRSKAITLAAKLNLDSVLNINFLPAAVSDSQCCIQNTLALSKKFDFPIEKIIFEFTEAEKFEDTLHLKRIIENYKSLGFKTAIDDFGSGYAGLNLLADIQTNIIKLNMDLIRNVGENPAQKAIVTHCLGMFEDMNIVPLAEGVETYEEYVWLKNAGVELMQGYLFAKPGFESLPIVDFSAY